MGVKVGFPPACSSDAFILSGFRKQNNNTGRRMCTNKDAIFNSCTGGCIPVCFLFN